VNGISSSADRTLERITVPLQTNGHNITFTGEVLGGEGIRLHFAERMQFSFPTTWRMAMV
jgi:hypothetical protein